MKKTFLAMLLLGGTMSMFGQTTGSGTGTTTGTSGSTGSSSTNSTTGSSTNSSTNNGSTMSGTNTTTNSSINNGVNNSGTMNNGATTNGSVNGTTANGTWNGVSASTSWTPEGEPAWGWNSYGNWQNMGSIYPVTNGSTNNNLSSANGSMNSTGAMNSTGSYSAYSGTAVANLPANVQMRFNQDFPTGANNQYSWNQYGDWFHTHYINNGRLWQYFYSQRGEGYALVLPVIQTYVPENIINSAVQKYGSSLYSIGMVKTNGGANTYQIGLIRGGQLAMQYLDENGASVADVWRTEDSTSMNSMQSNAAMDNSGSSSGNWNSNSNMNNQSSTDSNMNSQSGSDQTGDMNNQSSGNGKTKIKIKHADGSIDKIKTKNGETKVKSKPAPDNTNNQQQ